MIEERVPLESPLVNKQRIQPWLVPLLVVLLPGIALELLYLLIVALSPLPELHLYSSPLPSALPWTVAPSHLLFSRVWSSTDTLSLQVSLHLFLGLTLVMLVGCYALAIFGLIRLQRRENLSARWLVLIVAGTAIFGLTLLFQPALFSDDVFTYIFSGRILSTYHANPINTAPIQFLNDLFLPWVISGLNAPNIYGPLWLAIASLLSGIGQIPVAALLLFKGVALLSHVGNCLLIWAILSKIAPARRLLGTLLYAWNPLILIELAGSGHSEGILVNLILLAILLHVRGKGWWREGGMLLLFGLAISTNLIAFLLAPLYIWFSMRSKRSITRALLGACWRSCVILVCVALIYFPFWRGPSTLFAITAAIDTEHFIHSPMGSLAMPLRWAYTVTAKVSGFPPAMQPVLAADVTVRASATFIFVLIYFQLFGRVRRATTTIGGMRVSPDADQQMLLPGFDVLLDSWSIGLFWYIALVSGWFWPWYLLWVLWSVGLRRFDARTVSLLLLSGTALLTYPLLDFTNSLLAIYEPLFIFGIPILYLSIHRIRHKGRMAFANER